MKSYHTARSYALALRIDQKMLFNRFNTSIHVNTVLSSPPRSTQNFDSYLHIQFTSLLLSTHFAHLLDCSRIETNRLAIALSSFCREVDLGFLKLHTLKWLASPMEIFRDPDEMEGSQSVAEISSQVSPGVCQLPNPIVALFSRYILATAGPLSFSSTRFFR